MNFDINLTKDSFVAFQEYTIKRTCNSSSMKWMLSLYSMWYWILLGFFAIQIYFVYKRDICSDYLNLNMGLASLIILFISATIWQRLSQRILIKSAATDDGTVLGQWKVSISESEITESNDKCSASYRWIAIESVEKDGKNLYVFTDKVIALIFPLDQINDDIEAEIRKNVTSASN